MGNAIRLLYRKCCSDDKPHGVSALSRDLLSFEATSQVSLHCFLINFLLDQLTSFRFGPYYHLSVILCNDLLSLKQNQIPIHNIFFLILKILIMIESKLILGSWRAWKLCCVFYKGSSKLVRGTIHMIILNLSFLFALKSFNIPKSVFKVWKDTWGLEASQASASDRWGSCKACYHDSKGA